MVLKGVRRGEGLYGETEEDEPCEDVWIVLGSALNEDGPSGGTGESPRKEIKRKGRGLFV